MKAVLQIAARAGCLISILGPIVGIVLYPRANWLFLFPLLGVALLVFGGLTREDPPPLQVAERAEALLYGSYGGWDVDDYEHLNPKDPKLRDLWQSTMSVGGPPEEWVRLDEERKEQLKEVIRRLREMNTSGHLGELPRS